MSIPISRLKTGVNPELLSIVLIAVFAIITRLYQLGSFPYFPTAAPWFGDASQVACPPGMTGIFPGLYRDEMSRLCEIAFFPRALTTYEPSVQIIFEKISILLLGQNNFTDRLPSALASTLTAVLVYFTAKQLFKQRSAALISGLYYVFMIPAIIYGRMIFYENFVALFFVATLYCMSRFDDSGQRRWLFLAALTSALATLSKIDGFFVPVFFSIWAIPKGLKKSIAPLVLSWAPLVAGGVLILVLVGSLSGVLKQWFFGTVGSELSFQYLFVQSMPSGNSIFNQGYIKPEFWYIFAYVCLAALVVARSKAGRLLVEAFFLFVVTTFATFGMGSYYVIMVFPVLALAVGRGVQYLGRVGSVGALALYTVFYAPLVSSYVASVALPFIGINFPLSYEGDALILAPLAAWLVLLGVSHFAFNKRFPLAPIVLISFFVLLLIGTPQLYSYYFLGKAP